MQKDATYIYLLRRAITQFGRNTQGVYGILMVLLTIVIIGFIAIIVDGSGMMEDKARFTQGLEEAGLFVMAENNSYRKDKDHADLNSHLNQAERIQQRNQAMLSQVTRSYYLPDSAEINHNITDHYRYHCNETANDKATKCQISGYFDRTSWLYYGKGYQKNIGLSFNQTEPVGGTITVEKTKSTSTTTTTKQSPLAVDMILVLDLSTSMTNPPAGESYQDPKWECYYPYDPVSKTFSTDKSCGWSDSVSSKIYDVKQIIRKLSKQYFADPNSQHRLALVGFSGATKQIGDDQYIFPYIYNSPYYGSDYDYMETPHVNFDKTFSMIEHFTGAPLTGIPSEPETSNAFFKLPNYPNFWYTPKDIKILDANLHQVQAGGNTLASSGLIIATNEMFYHPQKNKNVKRIIAILSDGVDAQSSLTADLNNAGLCDHIRKRLNEGTTQKADIYFIAFSYTDDPQLVERDRNGWYKCVGKSNYFTASNADRILQDLQNIVSKSSSTQQTVEEVGDSINND